MRARRQIFSQQFDKYCLDANVPIEAWNKSYPISVFPSLWERLSSKQNDIILIKPIFNEIEPMQSSDRKLSDEEKRKKYPLRVWLQMNQFDEFPINGDDELIALELRKEYEVHENSKGIDENDSKLIAYAMNRDYTVVTYEAMQENRPSIKSNYKIPLVCKEKKVKCIRFVDMLERMGIRV